MKIETKYDIGQIVWFIADNKICSGKIISVDVSISLSQDSGYYSDATQTTRYLIPGYVGLINENFLFETKEDLINHLADKAN